ncbi:MAG: hypothetical protein ABIN68_01710 [Sphingomicrobium sp.]
MPKQAYYAARAIAERLQAQAATDARAAAAHMEMSARYQALAADPGLDPPTSRHPAGQGPRDVLLYPQPSLAWTPTD